MLYFTFYRDKLVKKGSAGMAVGPFIFIRPQYINDIGLLEHEKVHVEQWYKTFGLLPFLYLFSKSYRLKCEVEAYRKQLQYSPKDRVTRFATFISQDYGLDISVEDAKNLLLE